MKTAALVTLLTENNTVLSRVVQKKKQTTSSRRLSHFFFFFTKQQKPSSHLFRFLLPCNEGWPPLIGQRAARRLGSGGTTRNASPSLRWWIFSRRPWVWRRWQRRGWGRRVSPSFSGLCWESSASLFSVGRTKRFVLIMLRRHIKWCHSCKNGERRHTSFIYEDNKKKRPNAEPWGTPFLVYVSLALTLDQFRVWF